MNDRLTIPEEAIEAGAKALTEITHRPWGDCLPATREVLRRNARVPLEAAGPLIVAAALERQAEQFDQVDEQVGSFQVADRLRARAAELRGGEPQT
jgi:hypothetical protein